MIETLNEYSILYVEDEPDIKEDIEEYLSAYFSIVYSATDGEKALELYYKYQPDVLLLDISIPKINGLDLAKKIRKENSDVKIIMLTGHSDKERLLTAVELNLTKYLIKPFSPKSFKETLELLATKLQKSNVNYLHLGSNYVWNRQKETLTLQSNEIKLTEKEHRVLKFFINKQSQTISYEDIMVEAWDNSFEEEISLDSVKNLISRLRKKLPTNLIVSVYKKGYILKKI